MSADPNRQGGPGCVRLDERGWWLTRADALVLAGSLLVAGGVAATTWFGVGGGAAPTASDSGDAPNPTDGLDSVVGYVDDASTLPDTPGADASGGSDAAGSLPGAGLYAVVQNTRGFCEVLPLDADTTLTVSSDLGENVVAISGGAVRVDSSDCKNQVCVDSGSASWPGQVITCLPHQLVVQVVRDPADASRLS